MRVLTIFLRFGTDQYPTAEQDMDAIFRRQLPDVDRTVVVVDNAVDAGLVEQDGNRMLIGGDNSAWEFSGFDRAIRFIGPELERYDLVHVATSAFNTLYVAYLERFESRLLASVAGRPVCVGHIDCYNEPVDVLGFRTQHWIRSCFFFLPPTEIRILGTFVTVREHAEFFSGRPEAPFRPDAPLSETCRRYIVDWLTGGDIGQGVTWHSASALTPDSLASFEGKALAILNEHLLSVRLRAMGCRLIDVTWLSAQLTRGGPGAVQWSTGWREQMATRDRDAVIVPA